MVSAIYFQIIQKNIRRERERGGGREREEANVAII